MNPSDEQSTIFALNQSAKPLEAFGPPGKEDSNTLTDGRTEGAYLTAYGKGAWCQILFELIYLLAVLFFSLASLMLIAKYAVFKEKSGIVFDLLGPAEASGPLQLHATIALAGICGGTTSSLKWLYHTVAKKRWHQDRVIWRIVVPVLSGTIAVFSGMMIVSGLVPFLARTWLVNLTAGAAFGFFVGLFSDNLLAALEKIAFSLFGTMNERFPKKAEQDSPDPR